MRRKIFVISDLQLGGAGDLQCRFGQPNKDLVALAHQVLGRVATEPEAAC